MRLRPRGVLTPVADLGYAWKGFFASAGRATMSMKYELCNWTFSAQLLGSGARG